MVDTRPVTGLTQVKRRKESQPEAFVSRLRATDIRRSSCLVAASDVPLERRVHWRLEHDARLCPVLFASRLTGIRFMWVSSDPSEPQMLKRPDRDSRNQETRNHGIQRCRHVVGV